MSSNSLKFKGLQHGKSLEALSFLSQSVNSKNPKRERELARSRILSIESDIYKSFYLFFAVF
jgi:hypothetical protein